MRVTTFAAVLLGATLAAAPAFAQKATAAGPSRDQVRIQILDQCVISQSGKTAEEGAGPKCGCYAGRIVKAMNEEEIAAYKRGVPKRLTEEANKILATCSK